MNRSRRGWGQATCCRVACVLLAVMPVSLLHAATIWVEGNVEQVAANGDGRFGGCMAELDIELADAGLDCTGRWVTFDCAGGYGVEDADRLLKAVGAAVVAEKSVAMLVSDEEKHGDYCLASRIKVQDEPHVDDDSDGDGVLDLDDDVPLDASETVDTDDDGIGDNADADDDNDGILDADDPCPIDPNDNCIRPKDLFQNFLAEPIRSGASPGLIAAIVDRKGVRAISAAGVRKAGHSQPLLVTDAIHIGSNTKAMTSVMLATLVRDGTFANGWNTTIGGGVP